MSGWSRYRVGKERVKRLVQSLKRGFLVLGLGLSDSGLIMLHFWDMPWSGMKVVLNQTKHSPDWAYAYEPCIFIWPFAHGCFAHELSKFEASVSSIRPIAPQVWRNKVWGYFSLVKAAGTVWIGLDLARNAWMWAENIDCWALYLSIARSRFRTGVNRIWCSPDLGCRLAQIGPCILICLWGHVGVSLSGWSF